MKQKVIITFPVSKTRDQGFKDALEVLINLCGGATCSGKQQGIWLDPAGTAVNEDVATVSFLNDSFAGQGTGYSTLQDAVMGAVQALFRAGEQAVLVEWFRPGGYTFNIYEREEGHAESI